MNGREDFNYSFSAIKTLKIQKDNHLFNNFSRGKLGEVTTGIIQNSRMICMVTRRNMKKIVVLYVFVDIFLFS